MFCWSLSLFCWICDFKISIWLSSSPSLVRLFVSLNWSLFLTAAYVSLTLWKFSRSIKLFVVISWAKLIWSKENQLQKYLDMTLLLSLHDITNAFIKVMHVSDVTKTIQKCDCILCVGFCCLLIINYLIFSLCFRLPMLVPVIHSKLSLCCCLILLTDSFLDHL